jgi:hypothetical protein
MERLKALANEIDAAGRALRATLNDIDQARSRGATESPEAKSPVRKAARRRVRKTRS